MVDFLTEITQKLNTPTFVRISNKIFNGLDSHFGIFFSVGIDFVAQNKVIISLYPIRQKLNLRFIASCGINEDVVIFKILQVFDDFIHI